jgi:hypothetical protein
MMVKIPNRKLTNSFLQETWPSLAVLLVTVCIASFVTEFTFVSGIKALWKVLFRFLRLTLVLTLPILLLPHMCSMMKGIFNTKHRRLMQIQEEAGLNLDHLQVWFLRPLQGIGLSMLIAAKFVGVLQLYLGTPINERVIVPTGQFNLVRFLSANSILFLTSLFLLFLWTIDDLGIRQFNKKSGEVKMIGRYVGVLLPIIFGFYGIFALFGESARSQAIWYIVQMALVIYSPFVILAIIHSRYLRSHEAYLMKRLEVVKQTIAADPRRG